MRALAVVFSKPGVESRPAEKRVIRPTLQGAPSFDFSDNRGVKADADMESEVAIVDGAKSDALDGVVRERIEQHPGCLDGIVGESKGSRKDVGGATGNGGQCGRRAGQAVGRLVERAIASEDHDHIGTVGGSGGGEARRMAPAGGLRDGDGMVGSEGFGDDHPSPGGDRRGRWIDDQVHLHNTLDRSGALLVTSSPSSQKLLLL